MLIAAAESDALEYLGRAASFFLQDFGREKVATKTSGKLYSDAANQRYRRPTPSNQDSRTLVIRFPIDFFHPLWSQNTRVLRYSAESTRVNNDTVAALSIGARVGEQEIDG